MIIIEPRVEVLDELDRDKVYGTVERAARTCYKSEDKIADGSAERMVRALIKNGHEAMLEHFSFSVKFICDRGVTHELVRHRMCAFAQESQRYCAYTKKKFGSAITFIRPLFYHEGTMEYEVWKKSCENAEKSYFALINGGSTPEQARTVLPNSTKTEIVVTANLREWRHILKLRCDKAAHPQMRQVMDALLEVLRMKIPAVVEDIVKEGENDK